MIDVIIIGAGVIGASIARELSKYNIKISVLEKANDISEGTSKANSGIIHSGFDAKPGTLKAKLNVKGNSMFDKLSEELDFSFKRNGSLVLCFSESDILKLEALKIQGEINGVSNLSILNKSDLLKLEPNISENVVAALHAPNSGIISPYEFTIALCENANLNGVEFFLNTEVLDIKKENNIFNVKTNNGEFKSKIIINCTGVYSDNINNLISNNKIKIISRLGEYCLFDKSCGNIVSNTIFQLPTDLGKGVLVTPTIDGNLLVGPNAVENSSKNNVVTTKAGIDEILSKGKTSVKFLPNNNIITSFTGIRAHSLTGDFILGESIDIENFINCAGIESPGLSSAPAIAEMITDIIIKKLKPLKNKNFNPIRIGIPKLREMTYIERKNFIDKNPKYGNIICRCEVISEGEILDSIHRPLGATTLDGIKKRTRAGMGYCQSGFCSVEILKILSKELNIPMTEVLKNKKNSNLLLGKIKEI